MADETPEKPAPDEPAPTPAPTPAPPDPALLAKIDELQNTVKALAGARTTPPPATGDPNFGGLHPIVVQHARAKGMSDEEIRRNAPLIAPLVEGYLGLVGPEIMGAIGGVREELEEVRLSGNVKDAPHYTLLKDEVKSLRDAAKGRGEPLSLKAAYAVAVTNNIDKIIKAEREKADEPEAASAPARRAASASAEVGGRGARSRQSDPAALDPRSASSNELLSGLSSMSAADRKKWFDQHNDIPL